MAPSTLANRLTRIGGNGAIEKIGSSVNQSVYRVGQARSQSDLVKYVADPRVQTFLDFIAVAEGAKFGYHTAVSNSKFNNLSRHPGIRVRFKQTDGTYNTSDAAGRYQHLGKTWRALQQQYGFKDFSAANQDKAAVALILEKRGAMEDILQGNYAGAVNKLGEVWASFPSAPTSYKQKTKSWDFVHRFFKERKF